MNHGWIKLYRSLLDDPVWKQATHQQRSVLITVLLLASHCENRWTWSGKKYSCAPGQLVTSVRTLADKAGVTVKAARCAMERLRKLDFWALETAQDGTVITVRNWMKYQEPQEAQGHSGGHRWGTGGAHINNDKKERSTSLRKSAEESAHFDEFWKSYPKKKSKVDATKAWKQAKGDSIFNEIMDGLCRAVASADWQKDDGRFIPYPASWLRAGGWMDEAGSPTMKACQACRHYPASCQGKDETCSAYEAKA